MKNLIAANWKLNPITKEEAKNIFTGIKAGKKGAKSEVVVCPPFVYLPLLKGLALGAQNVSCEDKGAFTGEISAGMLTDLKVKYVIIGHSERRKYFGETDETVNKKIKKALAAGLKVIFCIGETAEERDAGKKNEVLERQIKNGLAGVDLTAQAGNIKYINIAYEPVWAIGTGNNCSVEETKQSIEFIRKTLVLSGVEGKRTRILYGGSVKSENSRAYIKDAGANGLLVGGASLNPEEFVKIVKSAE
jgi:triosephosphate isomerase